MPDAPQELPGLPICITSSGLLLFHNLKGGLGAWLSMASNRIPESALIDVSFSKVQRFAMGEAHASAVKLVELCERVVTGTQKEMAGCAAIPRTRLRAWYRLPPH